MGGGTGRLPEREVSRDGALPGRDVSRDGALPGRDVYISYLSHSVYMERILPGRFSSRPGKTGQFLSYKHSVPLCRDDIMLTLQIVPGEIVPGRNILT